MKRATTAALVAALMIPGSLLAQSDPGEGPEVTEPESSSLEVAPPVPGGAAPAGEVYVVKPGDTLWDLSQQFLGNPWYWPKVWSYNPEIENPHWIYPGNQIRFYPGAEELPAMVEAAPGAPEALGADEGDAPAAPEEVSDVSMGSMTSPDLLGQEDDVVAVAPGIKIGYTPPARNLVRQDGLVTRQELADAGIIDRAWSEIEMLSTFDKVYLRFRNRGAVRVGERYSIFRTAEEVEHPVTGQHYGYLTHVLGTLRITHLDGKTVTAVIEQSFDDIHRGDFVGPLGTFEKRVLTKANARQVRGVILASLRPELPYIGESHVVFVDRGLRDGVEEGNTFTVFRRGDPLFIDDPNERINRYPAEDVGMLVVFDVKENSCAALVVRSMRELTVGEPVEMRVSNDAPKQASATP